MFFATVVICGNLSLSLCDKRNHFDALEVPGSYATLSSCQQAGTLFVATTIKPGTRLKIYCGPSYIESVRSRAA